MSCETWKNRWEWFPPLFVGMLVGASRLCYHNKDNFFAEDNFFILTFHWHPIEVYIDYNYGCPRPAITAIIRGGKGAS